MHNFNHERLLISISAVRYARMCYEEAVKHALTRQTFGKRLVEHQVCRWSCFSVGWNVNGIWFFYI